MKLIRASIDDAKKIWEMQVRAFQDLYEKYKDTETNPAAEKLFKVQMRLKQPFTYYYFIDVNGTTAGAIRIIDRKDGTPKKISPVFVMPKYRNRGYAQQAIRLAEELHGNLDWELETILQEKANCYLYEKLGYCQAGSPKKINGKLTLVLYKKPK